MAIGIGIETESDSDPDPDPEVFEQRVCDPGVTGPLLGGHLFPRALCGPFIKPPAMRWLRDARETVGISGSGPEGHARQAKATRALKARYSKAPEGAKDSSPGLLSASGQKTE